MDSRPNDLYDLAPNFSAITGSISRNRMDARSYSLATIMTVCGSPRIPAMTVAHHEASTLRHDDLPTCRAVEMHADRWIRVPVSRSAGAA